MALTLAELFQVLVGGDVPVALRAYDGSSLDPPHAVGLLDIRTPRALRYLVTAPGELGLARAYVAGEIEVRGNLHATLSALASGWSGGVAWREMVRAVRRWMLRRPPVPVEESGPRWRRGLRRHTRARDASAIAHHYDLSNRFYELVLGPSMAYSCAVFTRPGATLLEAQTEKFDLVCRKLELRSGQRLLDVGAGWGGLVCHAAKNYGVHAVGVTLSRSQADWAMRTISQAGLQDRARVLLLDYRDVREKGFDAISSVGAMEHIGSANLGSHFQAMAARLREGGRMLNHAIMRASNRQRHRAGQFIDRYVFPEGELQSLGTVTAAMHDHGLEVRHEENLREHYALTLREWGQSLERNWAEAVREVGERRARVWRLYMAMARIGFERNSIQIHQILGVRVSPTGRSGMGLRPQWERAPALTRAAGSRPRRAVRRGASRVG